MINVNMIFFFNYILVIKTQILDMIFLKDKNIHIVSFIKLYINLEHQ